MITMELITLAKQHNEEAVFQIVEQFEPFIQQSLKQTNPQDREDLRQELRLSCIESIHAFQMESVPGFFEFCEKIQTGDRVSKRT
ncbi:helix-turn-helix domain-containing protein [Salibacterium aidingense]|uniref:helix-turn-helix domain-containing protein n=1 Tax=Salibacterium aidingense TaxID=384933 RepID=UPI003BBED260